MIASGHGENVFRWPLKRVIVFSTVAIKRRRRELTEGMYSIRMAMHGNKSQFNKAIKAIENG